MEEQVENTDVEIWRKPGATPGMEYYQPSIHVTQDNRIGIDVGGRVFQMPVEQWHSLAKEEFDDAPDLSDERKTPKGESKPTPLTNSIEEIIRQLIHNINNTEDTSNYVGEENEIDIAQAHQSIITKIKESLPEKRPDSVKQGEIIPFDGKKRVEMHWLRKTQDAGYNQAIKDMEERLSL